MRILARGIALGACALWLAAGPGWSATQPQLKKAEPGEMIRKADEPLRVALSVNPPGGAQVGVGIVELTASVSGGPRFLGLGSTLQYKYIVKRSTGEDVTNSTWIAHSSWRWGQGPGTFRLQVIAGIWKRDGTPVMFSNTAEVANYVVTGGATDPPYGWTHQVTSGNTNLAVTTRLGNAQDAIAGHTLQQIVTNANTKVRADNKACQECHGPGRIMPAWNAASIAGPQFCDHAQSFNASGSKPQILKDLFNNWKTRNCPN